MSVSDKERIMDLSSETKIELLRWAISQPTNSNDNVSDFLIRVNDEVIQLTKLIDRVIGLLSFSAKTKDGEYVQVKMGMDDEKARVIVLTPEREE